jgi:ribosomal-protein-alanine N-acetyltransferase
VYPVNESKSIRLEVTDEFYLSPIVRTDKAAYLEHFADPEIAHNLLAIPFPYTEADADWWLDRCEQSIGSPMTNFALRTPSGYLIGAIGGVGALSADAHSAEFGYWLAQSYRGRGLMPRVIRTFSDYAFQELRIHRLFATPFSSNPCVAPRTGEGRFSARRATQTSLPQARHLPRCNYLWTHF